MAVVRTTVKATIPISGLGTPSTSDCQVPITRPQETQGWRSQPVTWPGSR